MGPRVLGLAGHVGLRVSRLGVMGLRSLGPSSLGSGASGIEVFLALDFRV